MNKALHRPKVWDFFVSGRLRCGFSYPHCVVSVIINHLLTTLYGRRSLSARRHYDPCTYLLSILDPPSPTSIAKATETSTDPHYVPPPTYDEPNRTLFTLFIVHVITYIRSISPSFHSESPFHLHSKFTFNLRSHVVYSLVYPYRHLFTHLTYVAHRFVCQFILALLPPPSRVIFFNFFPGSYIAYGGRR
jgi:hypothetical protein